jgi:WD40 repeat protein/tRNA A-37 threonylcarbamoyl transferase component Bud32
MNTERERMLDEVVTSYLQAKEAGRTQDREELIAKHPDLAADLRAYFAAESQVQRVAAPLQADLDAPTVGLNGTSGPGTTIEYFGDYHLLEEIGRGGMGVVYKARQESLNRTVALKMILAGQLANDADVKRFRAEAEAAAKLDHPGIVPVFEVGQHDGHQYFSMAFVDGESLARKLIDGLPKPRDAAVLIKQVAEAVTYAHLEGVVHRDIKPANILLQSPQSIVPSPQSSARLGTEDWGLLTPRLTDFGLAKKVEGDSGLTQTGQIVGTPSYMPPEQASGKRDVGPLADVYSLGAVLYCLLTGRPPFQADNPLDTLMQVVQQEPVAPRQLNAAIPRDLETICLKCLEKDPRRRYGSAQELVADLGRFLDHQPIVARPITSWGRTVKWAQRRPTVAALAGVSAILLLASLVGGIAFNARLQWALEEVANRQTDLNRANAKADENNTRLQAALVDVGIKQKDLDEANRKGKEYGTIAQAQMRKSEGVLLTAQSVAVRPDDPALAMLLAIEGAKRHRDALANHALWDAMEACREEQTLYHPSDVYAAEFSPDGKWALTCGKDGAARLWDVATGKELHVFKEKVLIVPVVFGRFSPDGRRVLTISHPQHIDEPGALMSGGTSVSGKYEDDHWKGLVPVARLWDPANGKLIASWWQPYADGNYKFASPVSADFSPDGRFVAAGLGVYPDGRVEVREAATGKLVTMLTGHQKAVVSAAFSPDSTKVVTASVDETARIHEAATGKLLFELKGHTTGVMSARFSPNGKQVLTYGHGINYKTMSRGYDTYENAAARLWDAETGKELPSLLWGGDLKTWVWNASFNHDGTRIVTSGIDYFSENHFAIWDSATGKRAVTFKGETGGRRMKAIAAVFSPDSKRVASSSHDLTASIWDATSGEELHVLAGHTGKVRTVAFSADGQRLITASDDNTARIWDVADRNISARRRMLPWQTPVPIFSADGRRMYSLPMYKSSATELRVFDTTTGKITGEVVDHSLIRSIPVSIGYASGTVDYRWLAFPGPDVNTTVTIRDGGNLKDRFALSGHVRGVHAVVFSRSDEQPRAATIDGAGKLRLWDMADGKLLHTLVVDADHKIQEAHFDRSGRWLLTINPLRNDPKVKDDGVRACVWDVAKGTKIATLRPVHSKTELDETAAGRPRDYSLAQVTGAAFSADGELAMLAFESHASPRAFDATTGAQLHVFEQSAVQARVGAFSPDGKQIIIGTTGTKAGIWETATGKLLRTFDHEGSVHGVAFSPRGRLVLTNSDYKALRVWDTETGQLVAHFKDPIGIVRGAFSTDGQSLLLIYLRPDGSGSGKCAARISPIDPLAEALKRKPRELTAAEREQYGVRP